MEGERHETKRQGEADGERSTEEAMVEGRDGRTKEGRGGRAAQAEAATPRGGSLPVKATPRSRESVSGEV